MSNQDLLFNELTSNESDSIKGGHSIRRNRNNSNSNNVNSTITSITDSFVTGDVAVGNNSTIGAGSPITVGYFK